MIGRNLESLFDRYRRKGDVRALAQVFDRTARDLLALANHLVRDLDDAEDLVQSTFVTAIDRAQTYDRTRALLPWLTGILVHSAANHVRARARRRTDEVPVLEGNAPDPARCAEEAELGRSLDAALGRMGERYRRVLEPYLRRGQTPEEIARALDLAPGTVRTQIHRGLAQLRRLLPASVGAGLLVAGGHGLPAMRAAVLEHAGAGSTAAALAFTPGLVLGGLIVSKKIALIGAAAVLVALGAWWIPGDSLEPGGAQARAADGEAERDALELQTPSSSTLEPVRREANEVESGIETASAPATGRALLRGRVRGVRPEHLATLTLTVRGRSPDVAPGSQERREIEDMLADLAAQERAISDRAELEAALIAETITEWRSEIENPFAAEIATGNVRTNGTAEGEGLFEVDVTEDVVATAGGSASGSGTFRLLVGHELYFGATHDVDFGPAARARIAAGETVVAEAVIDLEPAAVLTGRVLPIPAPELGARVERLQMLAADLAKSEETAAGGQVEIQMQELVMQMQELDMLHASSGRIEVVLFRPGEREPIEAIRTNGAGDFHFKVREGGLFTLVAVTAQRPPLQIDVELQLAVEVELGDELPFPEGPAIEGFVEDYGAFPGGGVPLEAVRMPAPGDRTIAWRGVDVIWSGGKVVRSRVKTASSKDGTLLVEGLSPGPHILGLPSDIPRTFGTGVLSEFSAQVPVPATDVLLALPLAVIDVTVQWPPGSQGSSSLHLFTGSGSNGLPLPGTSSGRNGTFAVFVEPEVPVSLSTRHPGMKFDEWSGTAPARGARMSITLVGRVDE